MRAVDTNVLARYYLADDQAQARVAKRVLEVQAALELCAQGLEFADALHLSASSACTEMLTFDDRFVRRASRAKPKIPVGQPGSTRPAPPAAHEKRRRY